MSILSAAIFHVCLPGKVDALSRWGGGALHSSLCWWSWLGDTTVPTRGHTK